MNTICFPLRLANFPGSFSFKYSTALFNFWRVVTITTLELESSLRAFERSSVFPVPTISVFLLVFTPVE